MNIGIIGAGAWGSALAIESARGNNDITIWSYDGNTYQFDGIVFPKNIHSTGNMADLSSMDTWLIVVPSLYFRETIKKLAGFYNGQPIIICTKGIEAGTFEFMSEILNTELPVAINYGILSGPQFASEVANGIPTGSTLAGNSIVFHAGQAALPGLYLEHSSDIIGTQICGVGKNALALISGFNSVKCKGENERALLFTRAFGEIVQFGIEFGAKTETFMKLCGIGDLFLSATSTSSRNYSGGVAIANSEPIRGTVEGISALKGIIYRAKQKNQNIPILIEMSKKMNLI